MRKLLILTLVILLSAIWLEAQNGAAARVTGPTSLQGCLAYSNGNYILTNKSGNAYQLSSKRPNVLTHYVGQEIRVSGKPAESAPNKRTRDTAMQSATTSARDQQVFEVRNVTHLSDSCEPKSK
jgi:hypothetical protein